MGLIGWMRPAAGRSVVPLRVVTAGLVAVVCVLAACGGANAPTSGDQAVPTASAAGGGGGGAGAQPTPARTPLIKTLDMAGSPTFVRASPVPAGAACTITANVFFRQGAPQSVTAKRGPDPSNPGQVTWDISTRFDPSTITGTKWDVQCSASDASQPGGLWVAHGAADLGDFPKQSGSPPASSSR